MAKATNNPIYGLSDRYLRKMNKDILLNLLMTFMFYLVFNIMFKDHSAYSVIKVLFVFLFAGIAVFLVISGRKRAAKAASIHYEVKKDGLEYYDGKKTQFYPWMHFQEIRSNPNRFSMVYPYEFYTKEGMFLLHRQLGNPEELIPQIIKGAAPYAKVDSAIPDVLLPKDDWLESYLKRS